MGGYAEVWERFTARRRLEFGGYMDPGWQNGHNLSASLMVPVDASRFHERLEPLRTSLGRQPFVSLHPDHFMHITLLILGFVVPEPEGEGEISRTGLREIEQNARVGLSGFRAFPVELANLNAFPGAAFIEVHDDGMLQRLQDALCDVCGLKRPEGPPHLTVAYFQAPDGTPAPEGLISTIERYREWPIGVIPVDAVELTLLDLSSYYPVPERMARIDLRGDVAGPSG